MNFGPLLSGLATGATAAMLPTVMGQQGGAPGGIGSLAAALMAQRGTTPMAQQGFQMPTQPGTQFSMPAQAGAQYGQNGPGYQNALAQALMNYGGGGA